MSYWMGSCMDKTWNSELCFQQESCTRLPETGWTFNSPNIWHCYENATQWACGNSDGSIANETCADGRGFDFEVTGGGNPRIQNGTDVFPVGYALVNEADQSPSTSSSSSPPSSPTASNGACPEANPTGSANVTQSGSDEKVRSVSTGAAAGIGVGVGVPLLLWALLATAIAHRAQKRARASEATLQAGSNVSPQYQAQRPGTFEEMDGRVFHEVPARKHPMPELPSFLEPRASTPHR
ncbi:MAG: hypothetical protein M1820_001649 [Bogoriella megaspora]|nr:MAG: hypothetical protein M1820_001649 [Bogoriella megaspora]